MNIGNAVRNAVGQVAPTVGAALGGPLGNVVGRQVAHVLTGRPDASEDDLRAAVATMTPEQVAVLEAMEVQMTERERIAAQDRADARDMHEKTDSRSPDILLLATGAAFLGLLVLLAYVEPPEGSQSIVFGGVGTLGAAFMACVNFTVGSTTDSRRKTTGMLARLRP